MLKVQKCVRGDFDCLELFYVWDVVMWAACMLGSVYRTFQLALLTNVTPRSFTMQRIGIMLSYITVCVSVCVIIVVIFTETQNDSLYLAHKFILSLTNVCIDYSTVVSYDYLYIQYSKLVGRYYGQSYVQVIQSSIQTMKAISISKSLHSAWPATGHSTVHPLHYQLHQSYMTSRIDTEFALGFYLMTPRMPCSTTWMSPLLGGWWPCLNVHSKSECHMCWSIFMKPTNMLRNCH